jgi:hypothetical protein
VGLRGSVECDTAGADFDNREINSATRIFPNCFPPTSPSVHQTQAGDGRNEAAPTSRKIRAAAPTKNPVTRMMERFATARRGEIGGQIVPRARIRRAHEDHTPTAEEANAASMFRGKVQQHAARHLLRGRVLQTTMEVVAADIAHRWRPKTQEDKCRAAPP